MASTDIVFYPHSNYIQFPEDIYIDENVSIKFKAVSPNCASGYDCTNSIIAHFETSASANIIVEIEHKDEWSNVAPWSAKDATLEFILIIGRSYRFKKHDGTFLFGLQPPVPCIPAFNVVNRSLLSYPPYMRKIMSGQE